MVKKERELLDMRRRVEGVQQVFTDRDTVRPQGWGEPTVSYVYNPRRSRRFTI